MLPTLQRRLYFFFPFCPTPIYLTNRPELQPEAIVPDGWYLGGREKVLHQFLTIAEGLAYTLAYGEVMAVAGIVEDGVQEGGINLAGGVEDGVFGRDVDDLADEVVAFLVIGDEFAFEGHGEFFDDGGMDELGGDGVETGLGEFIGFAVAGDEADVVASGELADGADADGEGFGLEDVAGGLMALREADAYLIVRVDAAPGCIHDIGVAGFVVSGYDEDGHGV